MILDEENRRKRGTIIPEKLEEFWNNDKPFHYRKKENRCLLAYSPIRHLCPCRRVVNSQMRRVLQYKTNNARSWKFKDFSIPS
jgi:hypothetical protein